MSPRFAGFGLAMVLLVSSACGGDDSESADKPTARPSKAPSSSTTATAQASFTARPSATSPASATAAGSPTTAGAASPAPSATTAAQPTQPSGGLPTSVPPTSVPPTAVPPTAAPPPPTSPPSAPLQAFVTATSGDRWEPASVTIASGGTVFWSWDTANVHDLQGPGFSSGIGTPASFSHTFSAPGAFPYVCTIHPLMRGTVNVQ